MSSLLGITFVIIMPFADGNAVLNTAASDPFKIDEQVSYHHHLRCGPGEKIHIDNLEAGYKANKCDCVTASCCQHSPQDCLKTVPPDTWQHVTANCWNKNECNLTVLKPLDPCQKDGKSFESPKYSRVSYVCVPADSVVDMTNKTSASGSHVMASFFPGATQLGHQVTCSVDSLINSSKIVMVHAVISQRSPPLSCLKVSAALLCREGRAFKEVHVGTPFNISLQQTAGSQLQYAWAWLIAGASIKVTCSLREAILHATTAGTDTHEALGTDDDSVTRDVMTSKVQDGETSTSAPLSTSSGGQDPFESDNDDAIRPDTGSTVTVPVLVGGLVAALVVVTAAGGVAFFLWRRSHKARPIEDGRAADQGQLSRDGTDTTAEVRRNREGGGSLDSVERRGDSQEEDPAPVYTVSLKARGPRQTQSNPCTTPPCGKQDTQDASGQPSGQAAVSSTACLPKGESGNLRPQSDLMSSKSEDDVDYDVLGKKRNVNERRRDVTYGHLGMTGEADSDYDGLAVPGKVWSMDSDVTSAGNVYNLCDPGENPDAIEEDRNNVNIV